jgi:hypothetical protein
MTPAELASGWLNDLELDRHGVPLQPVILVDLDGEPASDLRAAVMAARSAVPLLVGVAHGSVQPPHRQLTEALTLTIASGPSGRESIVADDVDSAVEHVRGAVRRNPNAAVAFGHLLRQTESAEVRNGLEAEAATYSMLLSGSEFRGWLAHRRTSRRKKIPSRAAIDVERVGSTLRLTLHRPERRNAIDARLRDALVEGLELALASAEASLELRGVGPDFCSGGDLDEFGLAEDPVAAYMIRLQRHPGWLLHRVAERATAFLHGACIGAGIEIPAFAATVIASPDAHFRLPEVSMGLVPGAGGTVSIPRRIGRWRTAWMALTGDQLEARTAHEWGLVDSVV